MKGSIRTPWRLALAAVFAGVFLAGPCAVQALCPGASDPLWSDPGTWSALSLPVPTSGAKVTIPSGATVVLDTAGDVQVDSITVEGTLFIRSPPAPATGTQGERPGALFLTLAHILVKPGGFLSCGARECPVSRPGVVVTFTGARQPKEWSPMGVDPSDGATLGGKGLAVMTGGSVEMVGFTGAGGTWARLGETARAGSRVLRMSPGVGGSTAWWQAGDQVVVATTDFPGFDYHPDQNEFHTIAAVSADGSEVTLSADLKYDHYAGQVNKYSAGKPDVAAEVGLLTRSILLRGDAGSEASEYGGHVMIRGAARAVIDGVELVRMGQKGVIGRYPIHFHRVGDVVGRGFDVARNAIHHCLQRCVAVHDTDGVVVEGNVAALTNGHCYFLEDGPEVLNTFRDNLGVLAMPVAAGDNQIIPSDATPTMFWITNPNNTFVGNTAVGAVFGFWFALPPKPNGASEDKYAASQQMWPRLTPILEFRDNVAHSMVEMGLMLDQLQRMDGTIETAGYHPRVGPYVTGKEIWEYDPAPVHIDGFVAYKCRSHGVWTRGDWLRVTRARLFDNAAGALLIPGPTWFTDSLVVGETDNTGVDSSPGAWLPPIGRSRPVTWTNAFPIRGFINYDAGQAQFAADVEFRGFVHNTHRPAGAIGVLRNGPNMLLPSNRYKRLAFDQCQGCTRVHFESFPNAINDMNMLDGPKGVMAMDMDGSLIEGRSPGSWLVSGPEFNVQGVDGSCSAMDVTRSGVVYTCDPQFDPWIGLEVRNLDVASSDFAGTEAGGKNDIRATWRRLGSSASDPALEVTGRDPGDAVRLTYTANVRARNGYALHFAKGHATPPKLELRVSGGAIGDSVTVALPYPTGTTFTVTRTYANMPLRASSSAAGLAHDAYYYDAATQHLLVRVVSTDLDVRERYDGSMHDSWNSYVRVTASCTGAACAVPGAEAGLAVPAALPRTTQRYRAHLCVGGSGGGGGGGAGFAGTALFSLNPATGSLHYVVVLSGPAAAKGQAYRVAVGKTTGAADIASITLTGTVGPMRGTAPITLAQWAALQSGSLSVTVTTRGASAGTEPGTLAGITDGVAIASGAIACAESSSSLCAPPGSVEDLTSVCSAADTSSVPPVVVFDDALSGWSSWSWAKPSAPAVSAEASEALCGSGASIRLADMREGGLSLHSDAAGGTPVDASKLTHLEFWVRPDAASQRLPINLRVRVRGADEKPLLAPGWYESFTDVKPAFIHDLAIGDPGRYTRVRVPLADMGFPASGIQAVGLIDMILGAEDGTSNVFNVDRIRFVAVAGGTPAPGTPMTPPITTVAPMSPATAACNGGGGTGTGGSSPSPVPSSSAEPSALPSGAAMPSQGPTPSSAPPAGSLSFASFRPLSGHADGATLLTVTGRGFVSSATAASGGFTCFVGGKQSPASVLSDDSMVCVVPAGATSGVSGGSGAIVAVVSTGGAVHTFPRLFEILVDLSGGGSDGGTGGTTGGGGTTTGGTGGTGGSGVCPLVDAPFPCRGGCVASPMECLVSSEDAAEATGGGCGEHAMCWDGTCAAQGSMCAILPACPRDTVRCGTGHCVSISDPCPLPKTPAGNNNNNNATDPGLGGDDCSSENIQACPDGRCLATCHPFNGCPTGQRICPNGLCVGRDGSCTFGCAAGLVACADGSCADPADKDHCAGVATPAFGHKIRRASAVFDLSKGVELEAHFASSSSSSSSSSSPSTVAARVVVPPGALSRSGAQATGIGTLQLRATADSDLLGVTTPPSNWAHERSGILSAAVHADVDADVSVPFATPVEFYFDPVAVGVTAGDVAAGKVCLGFIDSVSNRWECSQFQVSIVALETSEAAENGTARVKALIDHFTPVALITVPAYDGDGSDGGEGTDGQKDGSGAEGAKILGIEKKWVVVGGAGVAGLLVVAAIAAVAVRSGRKRSSSRRAPGGVELGTNGAAGFSKI